MLKRNVGRQRCSFFLCLSAEIISFSLFRFSLHIYIYILLFICKISQVKKLTINGLKRKYLFTQHYVFFLYHHPLFTL